MLILSGASALKTWTQARKMNGTVRAMFPCRELDSEYEILFTPDDGEDDDTT